MIHNLSIETLLYYFAINPFPRSRMNAIFYSCPGCGKKVDSEAVKPHISSCHEYDSFYLNKIKKLTLEDNIDDMKFLSQQLALARNHLEYIISKKNSTGQDPFNFNFLINQESKSQQKNKNNSYNNKFEYQSQFQLEKEQSYFQDGYFQKLHGKFDEPKMNKMQEPKRMSYPKASMMNYEKQQFMLDEEQMIQYNQGDIVKCPLCKKKFYASYDIHKLQYIEECWHMSCKNCLKKYIEDEFISMGGFPKCPVQECSNKIPEHQSKQILGSDFESFQNRAMRKTANINIVECVKCKSQYDFAPGNPNDAPKKDDNGKPVNSEYAILYAEHRFVCPRPDCKTQQCKQCNATPYHLGMNCKEFKSRALMKKCRYCDTPITSANINKKSIPALADICNSKDCQQLANNACTKILPCSHPCCGVKNQKKCLPCLNEQCCENQLSLMGQKGDDYCSICYIEALSASPSIKCGCGHIFHMKCIKKRFQIKWLTPRILFNFCLCPLCKMWIEVPPQNQLFKTGQEMKQLHEKIQKMSLDRLKFQQLEKDEKLVNKQSPYFNKPKQYAMAIYAYFMCFKCKRPYFGGRKNCAQVMNNAQNAEGYDPKQLICPQCCDIPIQNCPKHGNDFIEFKCKFCCSIAQWFCWGNTHFCEPCHKRQCNGDYVSKYTKDQLPKCPGPGKCPIGGNHGQNGEEKMLGCAICRNYKQNSKNF